jgi:hypothetical protein
VGEGVDGQAWWEWVVGRRLRVGGVGRRLMVVEGGDDGRLGLRSG